MRIRVVYIYSLNLKSDENNEKNKKPDLINPTAEILLSRRGAFSKKFGSLHVPWLVLIDLNVKKKTAGVFSTYVAHMFPNVTHIFLIPSASL